MRKVDLVFRQIDERTRDVALQLAIKHIRPDAVHVMDNVRPFSECVARMLQIRHDCDYVVYVDADCLILEDMRQYIDTCDAAYVDSYVTDYFRGRVHCGVHITRIDVVRGMARLAPPDHDMRYVLRPESRLRDLAMRPLCVTKQFRNFDILHDYFQHYHHIFVKYAARELRSRTEQQYDRLSMAMRQWPSRADAAALDDHAVAEHAVAYARRNVSAYASPEEVHDFIASLPERAATELSRLGVASKASFAQADLDDWLARNESRPSYGAAERKPKIFGLGLSRTGTRSLTTALQVLGFDVSHYPADEDTYIELANGQYELSVLKYYDGISDITTVPYYQQLDRAYPGSKFILTLRDRASWLRSCQRHWHDRPAFREAEDQDDEIRLRMRQLLRAAVYGCYNFVPERFSWVYDRHVAEVMDYFRDRPEDLLIIDVCSGEGYEKLAPFLGRPIPMQPFPHKGNRLSQTLAAPLVLANANGQFAEL